MKKNKNGIIFKVSSKYCLKTIFSHVEYNKFLEIIKYNKKLQKLLEISSKNYSLDCEVKENKTYTESTKYIEYEKMTPVYAVMKVFLFLFQYVYIFVFLMKSPYRKLVIGKKYYNLITGFFSFLNYCFYFYILLSIVLILLSEKAIKAILIIDLILFSFATSMLIWIFTVILNIENYNINWIIICFIILLILYIIIIIYSFVYIILLFKCTEITIRNKIYKYILKKIKGIKIEDKEINKDFLKKNKIEQKRYILGILDNLEYQHTDSQTQIINLINFNRGLQRIPKLLQEKKFNELIIKGNSEVTLFLFNHIFKIKNNTYLFKYKKGEFYNNLKKNDKEILKILSIVQLNKVEVFEKDNYEFILVYNDNDILRVGINLRTGSDYSERNVFIYN